MAVVAIIGEQGVQLAVNQALKIGDHQASQDADLKALAAEIQQAVTVLKTFYDNNPDPKLTDLCAPLTHALKHGTALYEEAHAAHENYCAGVREVGATVGAFKWVTGNYAPQLQKCKEIIENEIQSVTVFAGRAQAQVPYGRHGGFEVGQQVYAWRKSQCWSAVRILEINAGIAMVVGNDCAGARFLKRIPLDLHYVKPSDWPTAQASFLPLTLQGVPVLVASGEEPNVWRVTNDGLKSTQSGIGYRRSKNLDDDTIAQGWCANWNDLLAGVDQGDGWVRCWPKLSQKVELKNQDDYDAVFIHLDNSQGEESCRLPNGTQLGVIGQYDGDSFMVEYKGKGYGVKKRHCKFLPAPQQAEFASSLPATGHRSR